MAIRTTAAAVTKLLEEEALPDEVDLTPFIEAANSLVDGVCLDSDYTDSRLEIIERWLAAHFYSVKDPRTKQEAAKGLTETYEGQTKYGLLFTRYGQQACVLDIDGNLRQLDVGGKGRIIGAVHYVGGEKE